MAVRARNGTAVRQFSKGAISGEQANLPTRSLITPKSGVLRLELLPLPDVKRPAFCTDGLQHVPWR